MGPFHDYSTKGMLSNARAILEKVSELAVSILKMKLRECHLLNFQVEDDICWIERQTHVNEELYEGT